MEASSYRTYWARKNLLASSVPRFPVRRWWPTDGLCEVEQLYFDAVRDSASLLDVGAGDLRTMKKFRAAGFRGDYQTLDIGGEFRYTYASMAEVQRSFGAIIFLDVLEHLNIVDGLKLLDQLVERLDPGGVLVLQTPNARCLPHPLSWDMTHLHCYNAGDLWAYLTAAGLSVAAYRVMFRKRSFSPLHDFRFWLSAYFVSRWLGCDYAENIGIVARKPHTAAGD